LRLNHVAAEWQCSPAADMLVMNGVGETLQAFGRRLASASRANSVSLSVPPGQQLVDPIDLVVSEAG
jgi:hypothetical protein